MIVSFHDCKAPPLTPTPQNCAMLSTKLDVFLAVINLLVILIRYAYRVLREELIYKQVFHSGDFFGTCRQVLLTRHMQCGDF